jgi:CRISPR system Cascade subunit CasC
MTVQPRFIQIHTLHTYPAALLNRDDAGLAKRLPLGNAMRTRISSQCLKRHWRVADDRYALSALDVPMAVRSRGTLELIRKRIVESGISVILAQRCAIEDLREGEPFDKASMGGKSEDALKRIVESGVLETLAQCAVEALREGGLLDKAGKERRGEDALKTGQAVLMGKSEIDYLVRRCTGLAAQEIKKLAQQYEDENNQENSEIDCIDYLVLMAQGSENQNHQREAVLKENLRRAVLKMLEDKDEKKNIAALKHGSGLESALFGRMVTSDVLASRDAAIYVSHAFTVHKAQVENDYFTVVDDLLQETGEQESAGIFDTELASGLYYGYVVVDVRQLIENLEGIKTNDCFANTTPAENRELAAQVIKHLLHLIATVSPGAKRGSTAPFDWAKFMLLEAGDWQPRSLAGAFHDALPLSNHNEEGTIRERAIKRMAQEIIAMDEAYGVSLSRRFLAVDPVEITGAKRANLTDLGDWAAEIIRQGVC